MVTLLTNSYHFPAPVQKFKTGIYEIGNKKLNFQIQNGFLVGNKIFRNFLNKIVRVGGGFITFDDWVKKHGTKEGIYPIEGTVLHAKRK
jgi:hypothetical protein